MRLSLLVLAATTALSTPGLADPLRDAALEFLAPLPATAPEIEGNPSSAEKIALGQALFFDSRLSASGQVSCNSCHNLADGGDDGLATPVLADGQAGLRNTATILNAALNETHFWDGRESDLAAQEAGPFMAGIAMLNAPDAALAAVKAVPGYADMFAAAFPGEADPVTLDNMAKALAVFSGTLLTPGPLDAWLQGDDAALNDAQKAGLQAFLDRGCAFCHFGPTLGGGDAYPLGLVELPGIDVLAADEVAAKAAADPEAEDFVFRTAPLRNITLTAPYFHAGKITDLAVAVDVMSAGQLGSPLDPAETASIVTFLESLTGTAPAVAAPTLP